MKTLVVLVRVDRDGWRSRARLLDQRLLDRRGNRGIRDRASKIRAKPSRGKHHDDGQTGTACHGALLSKEGTLPNLCAKE